MTKMKTGLFLALALTAGVAYTVFAQGDDVTRQMRDRAQIEDLMWRYTRALDTMNADAYAAAYTPDGVFTAGATATKGRDALKKMVADLKAQSDAAIKKGEARPPMYHMTANHHIEFPTADTARIHAYYLTAFAAAGQNTPLRIAAVGRSVDDLVRVNGQWLIKTRNVAPQN